VLERIVDLGINAEDHDSFSAPAGRDETPEERKRRERSKQERIGIAPLGIAGRFGYRVRFLPVRPEDEKAGAPTQMGIFTNAFGATHRIENRSI
jgi:hypothetical protein